ncbi:MAG: MotA/TolQ/ExbB proton channel family protein [Myxococcota bacterium]|nr:MotA/TolQ/ExbB proton channel family protein [Myxococcota bacterium]
MKSLYGIIGIGLVLTAVLMGSPLAHFIDLPSVAIVVGFTVFFTFAHHTAGKTLDAFRTGFGQNRLSAKEAHEAIRILWTSRTLASASGVVGSLIGFVTMLAHMDDPKSIGPAMAVALLTLLYGVLIAEVLVGPLINRIRNRIDEEPPEEVPTKNALVTVAAAPISVMTLFVLLLAFTL